MPCRLSRSRTCSITGLLTIGTIGFGRLIVDGRRREPSPPAMTTAFKARPLRTKRGRPQRPVYSDSDGDPARGRPFRAGPAGGRAGLAGAAGLGGGPPRRGSGEPPDG